MIARDALLQLSLGSKPLTEELRNRHYRRGTWLVDGWPFPVEPVCVLHPAGTALTKAKGFCEGTAGVLPLPISSEAKLNKIAPFSCIRVIFNEIAFWPFQCLHGPWSVG